MVTGMLNALSGLKVCAQKFQNSANNLANLQNSEFKKSTITISNVDIAEEMIAEIAAQIARNANAKIINSAEQIIGTILDIKF